MAEKLTRSALVTISRRGVERLRAGHGWGYRSDIVEAKDVPAGALVTVAEERGGRARPPHTRLLGTALYSTASQIALRMISTHSVRDLGQLFGERIREAIAYRERFVENTNAYRVIFSEGDFLPGLIVDRYNDILSMQVLTQAMDAEHIREVVISELKEKLQPAAMLEKVDARVRQLEQLPGKESGLVYEDAGQGRPALQGQLTTEFQMNGVRFVYEALGGQKTGAFLDQRENYAAAEKYARGEALDVFCYQGGFALHLAGTCG